MVPWLLAGLIAGGASLVGSLVNSFSSKSSVKNTNATNADIAAATNATNMQIASDNIRMQKEENQLNREFNSFEAEKAYERELDKMRQQYELQTQLNSPVEMVKRLREAGLNPALAYGDAGSMGSVSGGSSPSASYNTGLTPQLPSLVSPTMQPEPAFPNLATGVFDGMLKLYQMQVMKSQSGNLDAETQTLYDTLKEKIRGLELSNNAQEDINRLRRAFEPFERQLGLDEKWSQIELLTEEAYQAASQGRLNDALKAKSDADKILSDAAAKVKGKEGELLDEQIKWYGKSQAANINHLNATSEESRANVKLIERKAITEQHNQRLITQEIFNKIQEERGISLDNEQKDKLTPLIEKKLKAESEISRADAQDFNYWAKAILSSAGGVAGMLKAAGIFVGM